MDDWKRIWLGRETDEWELGKTTCANPNQDKEKDR